MPPVDQKKAARSGQEKTRTRTVMRYQHFVPGSDRCRPDSTRPREGQPLAAGGNLPGVVTRGYTGAIPAGVAQASSQRRRLPSPIDTEELKMPSPTIVLVHGAFADASTWRPVFDRLDREGHAVLAPPNPLRGVPYDSSYTTSL